jgi:hypothetical protein
MDRAELRQELLRLFENPPEGIAPGSELDVRRFLRLGLGGQVYAGALIEHGEVCSITEAVTTAEAAQEEVERRSRRTD